MLSTPLTFREGLGFEGSWSTRRRKDWGSRVPGRPKTAHLSLQPTTGPMPRSILAPDGLFFPFPMLNWYGLMALSPCRPGLYNHAALSAISRCFRFSRNPRNSQQLPTYMHGLLCHVCQSFLLFALVSVTACDPELRSPLALGALSLRNGHSSNADHGQPPVAELLSYHQV